MQARSERTLPKSNRTALKSLIFVAVLLTLGATTIAQADTITVAGSTAFNATIMVPHQKEIEAISGHTLIVLPSKTDLGVRLLLEKRADLAMISTALELLSRSLRETDPPLPLDQLRSFDVYRSSVAYTVHPSNRLRSIKTEQLRKVLLGTITNWRELGGSDLRIRLVMVESGAGIPLTLETLLLRGKPISAKNSIKAPIRSHVSQLVPHDPTPPPLTPRNTTPHT